MIGFRKVPKYAVAKQCEASAVVLLHGSMTILLQSGQSKETVPGRESKKAYDGELSGLIGCSSRRRTCLESIRYSWNSG